MKIKNEKKALQMFCSADTYASNLYARLSIACMMAR